MPRHALCALAVVASFATAARADTVYVVSFTTGELVRYDSADPSGTKTVLSGSGSLVKPGALAIGPDGNLYIGEDGDGSSFAPRVSKFDLATNTLSTVIAFGAFDVFPGSLVFKGDDLLIGRNPFYGNTGPIMKLANATGGPLALGAYTTGAALASSPGLALAADGGLYVADQTYDFISGVASGPVKRFDAAGTYVGDVIGSGSSGLAGPTGLAITGSTLYTASIMNGTVLRTDLATDATTAFGSVGSPFEVGTLALLAGGGLLAGSPSGSGAIYEFAANGTLVRTYASGLGQIGGIAAVPEPSVLAAIPVAVGAAWCLRRRRQP